MLVGTSCIHLYSKPLFAGERKIFPWNLVSLQKLMTLDNDVSKKNRSTQKREHCF